MYCFTCNPVDGKHSAACRQNNRSESYPAIIFDGYAVYQGMTDDAKKRTSPDNVSDVLDSVAKLIRESLTRPPDNERKVRSGVKMT